MSVAEQVIKEYQALEGKKDKAIKELLSQRQEIDRQLEMLGHTRPATRGRKPGSKNKQPSGTSKKAASKSSKKSSKKGSKPAAG